MRCLSWMWEALGACRSRFYTLGSSASLGAALLVLFALFAMLCENTGLQGTYRAVMAYEAGPVAGPLNLHKSVAHWISDGLMVLFFLGVGLDIKRELLHGRLSSPSQALLPAIGALGGMCIPALIFTAFNAGTDSIRGWAIPSATDIAFSLAVLGLVGRGLPPSLRVFLTALAVLDDFGAIVIIALFYSESLVLGALAVAGGALLTLVLLNRAGVRAIWPYAICGVALWAAISASGIHATIAGVLLAFTIPIGTPESGGTPVADRISEWLQPWVALIILPLFAFANAGVSFAGFSLSLLFHPVVLGIALGLFLGKQIGVFSTAWLTVRLGICAKPDGATWFQFYGVAVLTGIGFTMSLFTAALAFPDPAWAPVCRFGVIAGSLLSTVFGAVLLAIERRSARTPEAIQA